MGKVHKMPEYAQASLFDSSATFSNLWALDIGEVTGHNLEMRGREEVNRLLGEGWLLLHIYTLKYDEDGTWRERPMAILGRPRNAKPMRSTARPDKISGKAEGSKSATLAPLLRDEDLPHARSRNGTGNQPPGDRETQQTRRNRHTRAVSSHRDVTAVTAGEPFRNVLLNQSGEEGSTGETGTVTEL